MHQFEVLTELPPDYLGAIGQMCFRWSLIERGLQQITYGLLKIGEKHGRVSVRSPRASDQISMIQQLMSIEELTSTVDLTVFASVLGRMEKMRDLVAHGIWLKGDAGGILIQDLAGNWRPDPTKPKVAKRIKPEAIPILSTEIFQAANLMLPMMAGIRKLAQELQAQRLALLKKSP